MLPAATKAGGVCMGLPDVCKVPAPPAPPIPTPFPNVGMLACATNESRKVMIANKSVLVVTSKLPSSMGDQAGSAGGVISGMAGGEVGFRRGSAKVMIEGKPSIMLTATSAHNGANANFPAGLFCTPGQASVLVAP